MAKDESIAGKATIDLWDNEKGMLRDAIETHSASLRRKINTERNPIIRQIHEKALAVFSRPDISGFIITPRAAKPRYKEGVVLQNKGCYVVNSCH